MPATDDLPEDFAVRRLRVVRRDGYRCQWRTPTGIKCNAPAARVIRRDPGGRFGLDNLHTVCNTHAGGSL